MTAEILFDDESEPDYDLGPAECDGLEDADWRLRKLARVRAERARIVEAFSEEVVRLMNRRDELLAPLDNEIAYWSEPLARLHERLLEADPKRKTIALPNGVLKARKIPATFEYPDEAAFVEWATDEGLHDWVRVKVTADKVRVKKDLIETRGVNADTGEIVPGLEYVEPSTSFTVET
jgi:phage host-nuclease inhibitor protein Gam